ncbi:hypothetical protein D3C87_1402640 [compost metagenome]
MGLVASPLVVLITADAPLGVPNKVTLANAVDEQKAAAAIKPIEYVCNFGKSPILVSKHGAWPLSKGQPDLCLLMGLFSGALCNYPTAAQGIYSK